MPTANRRAISNEVLESVIAKVRTNVCGQVADWREEDLNVGAGDELGIHSSGILEERTTE